MKSNLIRVTGTLIVIFGMISCNIGNVPNSGNRQTDRQVATNDGVTTVQTNNTNETLDYYLRRVSGVVVKGSGPSASVTIRGDNSLIMSTEPLFILDGVQITSYASVYNAIDPMEIASVTVLKNAAETAIYGIRGGSGVIIIKRKKAN